VDNLPPAAAISFDRFGGKTFIQEQISTIQSTGATRIANNPNRLRISFINQGSYDVRLSNTPDVSVISGWLLAAAGGVISMDWSEDGEGVTYEVYLLAVSNTADVRIREVIRS
jgi:hypothetical protein